MRYDDDVNSSREVCWCWSENDRTKYFDNISYDSRAWPRLSVILRLITVHMVNVKLVWRLVQLVGTATGRRRTVRMWRVIVTRHVTVIAVSRLLLFTVSHTHTHSIVTVIAVSRLLLFTVSHTHTHTLHTAVYSQDSVLIFCIFGSLISFPTKIPSSSSS